MSSYQVGNSKRLWMREQISIKSGSFSGVRMPWRMKKSSRTTTTTTHS